MEVLNKAIKAFLSVSYGDGDGSGSGYGDGSGDGSGSGSGYGYGDGSGDGSGSGSGSGSGDGDGYGIKTYNGQKVYYIDDVPTLIDAVHGDTARGSIVQRDLTLKPCFIARSGKSFAHGDTLHDAMNDAQQKELEDSPLEERIASFVEGHPDPDALHPCKELHSWHHTLTGSCKMGRDQFVKEHGLDMEADYSVRYFIEITASAYGGDIIRQLAQAYGITPTP